MAVNTDEQKAVGELAYVNELKTMVAKEFPNIGELWKYNAKGTLKILKAQGVVSCQHQKIVATTEDLHLEGNNNIITWREFKLVIGRFWERVNNETLLEEARKIMTDELHSDIVKRFPKWPTVEAKEQEAIIKFDKQSNYKKNDVTVYWTAVGYVKIRDVRKARRKYYTECESDCVTLKVLKLHHSEARKIEALCIKDYNGAKAAADRNGYKDETLKNLTWDDF